MSIYGYTTKADLSRFGSFLMMGLFGIIIAGLVNMFLHSSALQFAISIIGVVVFVGPDRLRHAADQGDLRAVRLCRGHRRCGQAQRL